MLALMEEIVFQVVAYVHLGSPVIDAKLVCITNTIYHLISYYINSQAKYYKALDVTATRIIQNV